MKPGMRTPAIRAALPRAAARVFVLAPLLVLATGCGDEESGVGQITPHIERILTAGEIPVVPLASGDTVHLGPEAASFYRARDFRPVWTGDDGLEERGDSLIGALRRSSEEGLDPAAYHVEGVEGLIERIRASAADGDAVAAELGTLDALLTESFLRLATDLSRGRMDPEAGGVAWNIERGPMPDAAVLESLLGDQSVEAVLDSVRPAVPHYVRLQEALGRYRTAVEAGGWPEISEGEAPEVGQRDGRVRLLRQRLALEADPVEERLVRQDSAADADVYTERLAQAVERFQERHGLAPDGVLGGSTLEALNVPAEARVGDIQLNLDRWRWLPRELGERYILVNVAGFELVVMEENRPALTMNVVVGKTAWQTPIFQDTMEHLVFNPYWNVPASIEQEEILPAVRNDPGYLARNDFEVVTRSGERVDPAALASTPPGEASPYLVRQRPGPGNALGRVKFMFPNDNNIYLHDTPARNLFSQRSRAFSHGCIRVEQPVELARYLLEHATDRPASDVESLMGGEQERWVNLDQPVPVYILYFTAWADEGGSVHFHEDIYGRDVEVEDELRAKLAPPVPPEDLPAGDGAAPATDRA